MLPTVLFLATVVWSLILRSHLINRINAETMPQKGKKLVDTIVTAHFVDSLLAEQVVLFMINGLSTLLVLEDQISGTVLMVIGIVLSVSLLLYTSRYELAWSKIFLVYMVILAFVCGQFGFLLTYGQIPVPISWAIALILGVVMIIASRLIDRGDHKSRRRRARSVRGP